MDLFDTKPRFRVHSVYFQVYVVYDGQGGMECRTIRQKRPRGAPR